MLPLEVAAQRNQNLNFHILHLQAALTTPGSRELLLVTFSCKTDMIGQSELLPRATYAALI